MKQLLIAAALVAVLTVGAWAQPAIDGTITAGEYKNTKAFLGGELTLSWAVDAQGGLSVAVKAKTKGWVGVGFGSEKMAKSYIYMGFVGDQGKAVFSEQAGKGHGHSDSGKVTSDKHALTQAKGFTILEFHVLASKLPFSGKTVPVIVAFGESTDLSAYHEENREAGSITLN